MRLFRVVQLVGLALIIAGIGFGLEYESFKGSQGHGYTVGFSLSAGNYVLMGIGLLLSIIPKWLAGRPVKAG